MPTRRGAISATNAIFLAIIVASLAVVMLVRGGAGNAAASEGLFTTASFEQAAATAAEQDKLVFVLATADWCGPCQQLRGGPLASPDLQAHINRLAVPYKLDVTNAESLSQADAQLAANLNVGGIPALYLIDQNRNVVASTVGSMSESSLSSWFTSAAQAK